jgi:hypothetical protein
MCKNILDNRNFFMIFNFKKPEKDKLYISDMNILRAILHRSLFINKY